MAYVLPKNIVLILHILSFGSGIGRVTGRKHQLNDQVTAVQQDSPLFLYLTNHIWNDMLRTISLQQWNHHI